MTSQADSADSIPSPAPLLGAPGFYASQGPACNLRARTVRFLPSLGLDELGACGVAHRVGQGALPPSLREAGRQAEKICGPLTPTGVYDAQPALAEYRPHAYFPDQILK